MIKTEFSGNRQWLAPTFLLGKRKQDLFLHGDVPEQACTKLGIGSKIDLFRTAGSPIKQFGQTKMIIDKEPVNRSRR